MARIRPRTRVSALCLAPEGTGKTPNTMAEAAVSWEDSHF